MFALVVDLFGLSCCILAICLRWLRHLVVFGLVLVLACGGGLWLIVIVRG